VSTFLLTSTHRSENEKIEAETEELSEGIRKSINDFVWEDEYRTVNKKQQ